MRATIAGIMIASRIGFTKAAVDARLFRSFLLSVLTRETVFYCRHGHGLFLIMVASRTALTGVFLEAFPSVFAGIADETFFGFVVCK
jgi:hypothetical protein